MTLETLIITLSFFLLFGIVMYAMLDGFDLGIGNTFLFFKPENRGEMMDTIAPVWDGNETWIIYFGTISIAAFPVLFYGVIPSLYIPAILMVAGLLIRGISFEFRLKAQGKDKKIWDFTFFLGSFLASFLQGMLLGAAFSSLTIINGVYVGGQFDFLTPFTVLTGLLTVVVYSILGLSYLRYKTEGAVAEKAVKMLKPLMCVSITGTFVVEIIIFNTLLPVKEQILNQSVRVIGISILSLLSIVALVMFFKSLKEKHHTVKTFVFAICLFLISLVKKIFMFWPIAVFPNYTIFQAANSEPALRFTFWLLTAFLPIILLYTIFVYLTFKGKITSKDRYYS